MSLRVNQPHNNSLIYIYVHACTSTQDLIVCRVACLSFLNCILLADTTLYPEELPK